MWIDSKKLPGFCGLWVVMRKAFSNLQPCKSVSDSAWTVQKWWRATKESMTHGAEIRLCKKSRGSRLLSRALLWLLQRIYDVGTGFAVSWIWTALLPDSVQSAFLLHCLHCFASVLQWADWQGPKLHAKVPALLQENRCASCRNKEIMHLVSAIHLGRDSLGNSEEPGEGVARYSFFAVIYRRENNLHVDTALRTAWYSLCPPQQRIAGCLHTRRTDPDCHIHEAGMMGSLIISPRWNPIRKSNFIAVCTSFTSLLYPLLSLTV